MVKPAAADLDGIRTAVVSSDRYEAELARRCSVLFGARLRVKRIYRRNRFVTEGHVSVPRRRRSALSRRLSQMVYAPERRWSLSQRLVRAFFADENHRFWHDRPEPPHWSNHRCTLGLWSDHRDAAFVERGCYARELMRPGCRVLDLCCGDGFYAFHFYSGTAAVVDAVDLDGEALAVARRHHQADNINFHRLDVVTDSFPRPRYDVVCWDGALGHFDADQIERLLAKIAASLGDDGTLCGSEAIEGIEDMSWDHKIALKSAENLRAILARHFPCVRLLERPEPTPTVYFRCARSEQRLGGFR